MGPSSSKWTVGNKEDPGPLAVLQKARDERGGVEEAAAVLDRDNVHHVPRGDQLVQGDIRKPNMPHKPFSLQVPELANALFAEPEGKEKKERK